MLEPDVRAVLIDQLRPPLGFRLDGAVATTFSLDLAAALIPPLAFASFEIRQSPDPIAALEAVRSCADRVDLFCQAGQIRVPETASDLMAFLEPMVHEVTVSRPGHLFHPKVWFLRYVSDGEPDAYRLLCTSRNLTTDRCWDAVVRLDGRRTTRRRPENRGLAALVGHLPSRTVQRLGSHRLGRIRRLAEDAHYLEWDRPEDVQEIMTHVWGVPDEPAEPDFGGYRHLLVTPFCNDDGVAQLIDGSDDVTVVSRTEDLDRLAPDTLAMIDRTLVLDPMAGLAEPDEAESVSRASLFTGLHAKVVVVERSRRAHVFIGSANATSAAFDGNVEFMVEMVGGATRIGVDSILASDTGLQSVLIPYATSGGAPPDRDDEEMRALRAIIRQLAACRYTLTVSAADEGHDVVLTSSRIPGLPEGHRAAAEILTRPGNAYPLAAGIRVDVEFAAVPTTDITPFVTLRVSGPGDRSVGCVVRARLIGDPAGRLDQILARQVDTPEKFLRFLALVLGLGDPEALVLGSGADTGSAAFRGGGSVGVLELVVRALAHDPRSLTDLDRLVRSLQATERGREVLPRGFDRLWSTVLRAMADRDTVRA